MSIRPIDMQGMVRTSNYNSQSSIGEHTQQNMANAQAFQKNMDIQAQNSSHKAEKPSEERKKLNKDGKNKNEQQRRNRKRRDREEPDTEDNNSLKESRSMFDVSI